MPQMGFTSGEQVTTPFVSDAPRTRVSPVPRGHGPDEMGRARGRLARRGLPDRVAARAGADLSLVGALPRHLHRGVDARPAAPRRRAPLARAAGPPLAFPVRPPAVGGAPRPFLPAR